MNEPNDISNNLLLRTSQSTFTHINSNHNPVQASITGILDYKDDFSGQSVGGRNFPTLDKLKSIVIGSGITELKSSCFNMSNVSSSNLESVDFTHATGLTKINVSSFRSCSELTSIDFTNATSLLNIRPYTFTDCNKLENVTFGSSITTLASYIFTGCTSLSNITFNNNSQLDSVGTFLFSLDNNSTPTENSNAISITMDSNLASTLGVTLATTQFKGASNVTFTIIIEINNGDSYDLVTIDNENDRYYTIDEIISPSHGTLNLIDTSNPFSVGETIVRYTHDGTNQNQTENIEYKLNKKQSGTGIVGPITLETTTYSHTINISSTPEVEPEAEPEQEPEAEPEQEPESEPEQEPES